MASRFASASTVEGASDAHAPTPGLYQPEVRSKAVIEEEAKRKAKDDEERMKREKEENMNDRQRAAKAEMFGHLTRQVKVWYPPRLLCKRFGVPDSHPERAGDAIQDDREERGEQGAGRGDGDPFYGSGSRGEVKEERFARSEARRELKRGEERWERSKRELLGLVGERPWEARGGQPITGSTLDAAEEGGLLQDVPSQAGNSAKPLDLEHVGLGEDEEALKEIDSFVKVSRQILKSVFAPEEEDEEQPSLLEDQDEDGKSHQGPASRAQDIPNDASTLPVKPTFIPRNKRTIAGENPSAVKIGSKKRKKDQKKSSAGGALTFSFDDDAEEGNEGEQRMVGKISKKKTGMRLAGKSKARGGENEGGEVKEDGRGEELKEVSKSEGQKEEGGEEGQFPSSSSLKNGPSRLRAADLF